jgi:hypothetical protein
MRWVGQSHFIPRGILAIAYVYFHYNGWLTIEEFYLPFGGKLDPSNRWVVLSNVIPWQHLECLNNPLPSQHWCAR